MGEVKECATKSGGGGSCTWKGEKKIATGEGERDEKGVISVPDEGGDGWSTWWGGRDSDKGCEVQIEDEFVMNEDGGLKHDVTVVCYNVWRMMRSWKGV